MSDFSIRVIPSSAQRVAASIGGMGSYLDRFTRDMLYQEAALAARAFIKFTPPILKKGGGGDSKEAQRIGEGAVASDIRSFTMAKEVSTTSMFAELNDDFQSFLAWKQTPTRRGMDYSHPITYKIKMDPDNDRAYRKMKNLRGAAGDRYRDLVRKADNEAALRSVHDRLRRDYKGRIRKMGGPGYEFESRPVVAPQVVIDRYTKQRQKAVGRLNSAWWQVILKVPAVRIRGADRFAGRTGVPNWIKRHVGPGLFIDQVGAKAGPSSAVTIVNQIGDTHSISTEARVKARVISSRRAAIRARPWQQVLNQALLVTNRGGRPA
jgi:hypothetical protein